MMRFDPNIVRRLRHERGWSQSDLAAACGWSKQRVSNIERGDAVMSTTIAKLAKAFGIDDANVFFVSEDAE